MLFDCQSGLSLSRCSTVRYISCAFAGTLAAFILGCGGSSPSSTGSPSGNTLVTLVSTTTANDQLSYYEVVFTSLALTNKAGKQVNLISSPLTVGFLPVLGNAEPLLTVSVPQDTYVSAAATLSWAGYGCDYLNSQGGLVHANYADEVPETSPQVTVNLPAPVQIEGSSIHLLLDLLVSQSASWEPSGANCNPPDFSDTITPTFDLTAAALTAQPGEISNGRMMGLDGKVSSVDPAGDTLTVEAADGVSALPGAAAVWQIHTDSTTMYQGASGISGVSVGTVVNLDGTMQPDGSLLASRIQLIDSNPSNLATAIGELTQVNAAVPVLSATAEFGWGGVVSGGDNYFNFNNATFQLSGQLTNLQVLPFPPSFTSVNMVAGQQVFITTHATTIQPVPTYVPASTITLIPQTINGTVTGVSSEGGFTVYTITLAPYDLFPQLAVQPGQTSLLTSPNTVTVYADSYAQMLNTSPVAAGGVFRFYGLVFNDNGVLRMDCAQISDGVPE